MYRLKSRNSDVASGARASYVSDFSSYRVKNNGPNGILKINLFSAHIQVAFVSDIYLCIIYIHYT